MHFLWVSSSTPLPLPRQVPRLGGGLHIDGGGSGQTTRLSLWGGQLKGGAQPGRPSTAGGLTAQSPDTKTGQVMLTEP